MIDISYLPFVPSDIINPEKKQFGTLRAEVNGEKSQGFQRRRDPTKVLKIKLLLVMSLLLLLLLLTYYYYHLDNFFKAQ